MTRRIELSATNFKISKPGFDVTTTSDIDSLIVDGVNTGLGVYQTGTINIAARSRAAISYSNPFGTIPYVMAQYSRGSDAVGGGLYDHTSTTSTAEDTVPPTRVYETNPVSADCLGFDIWHSTAAITITNMDTSTRTFRYVIFYAAAATGTGSTGDPVPDAMDWTNISGASGATEVGGNSQTVTGITGPIALGVSCSPVMPTGQSLRLKVNGATSTSISAGSSSQSITVQNGDQVGFAMFGTTAYTGTVTVSNLTAGGTIDTFTVAVTSAPNYGVTADWPNVTKTANGGGGRLVLNSGNGYINSGPTDGPKTYIGGTLNTTANLIIQANRALAGSEILQVYRNHNDGSSYNSGLPVAEIDAGSSYVSFDVAFGDNIIFQHSNIGSSTLSFTITNLSASGATVDTYTSTLTDTFAASPDYTPNTINLFDIDSESFNSSPIGAFAGNVNTLTGINQPIQLRMTTSATVPSNVSINLWKNNTASIIGMTNTASVSASATVSVNDTIDARASKSGVGSFNCTVSLWNDSDGGALLDTFNVTLTVHSGPPE